MSELPQTQVVEESQVTGDVLTPTIDSPLATSDGEYKFPRLKPGKGNPQAKRIHEYRLALRSAISIKDFQAVVRAIARKAMRGDVLAAREIFNRILGLPVQPVELSGADGEPLVMTPHVLLTAIRDAAIGAGEQPQALPMIDQVVSEPIDSMTSAYL